MKKTKTKAVATVGIVPNEYSATGWILDVEMPGMGNMVHFQFETQECDLSIVKEKAVEQCRTRFNYHGTVNIKHSRQK